MATTNELVNRIKRRLSRQNTPGIDADILDELAQAKERLERKPTLPAFLLVKQEINSALEEIDLSTTLTRFIRVWNSDGVRYNNGTTEEPWTKIEKFESLDRLQDRHPGTAQFPLGYCVFGDNIILRPRPTAALDYRIRFYQTEATAPAAGNSTKWTLRESELLMANAGMVLAQQLRDKDALAFFNSMWQRAEREFYHRQVADEWADFDSSRGED